MQESGILASMANSQRTANTITRRAMGALVSALLLIGVLPCAALPPREDIEWLDVWLPHTNDHDLPHVLLIGDSITRGYGPIVEKALAGRAYVGRLATSKSLGDPALLSEIELILQTNRVDVIHFNNGLHGPKYSEQDYADALPALLAVFKRTAPNARLIWANSTNVVVVRSSGEVTQPRIAERNRLAAAVVTKQGIPIDDLFSVVNDHPEYHLADGVHFTDIGYEKLAAHVAAAVSGLLAPADCSGLGSLALPGTTLQAQRESPGHFQVPDPSPFVPDLGALPGFCRVTAQIRAVAGSEIGVEIWLPTAWNRRMLEVGNGGFAGAINYAGLAAAIKQGFVGVSTDDGHRTPASVTPTAAWSIGHAERIVDFGHRAVHLASVTAKSVTNRFFGEPPDHSYFSGCSDGGREALMSAQRNPEDFDGWAVGAPANAWTSLMSGFVYVSRQVKSLPTPAFSTLALETLRQSALSQCDGLDGVKDGIIGEPGACHFNPRQLVCKNAASSGCLSLGQAQVAANIYRGPPAFGGMSIPGYADTVGAEDFWALWLTGPVPAAFAEPSVASFGRAYFAQMVYQQNERDLSTIPLSKLFADGRAGPGREVDAVDPDLNRVRGAGKKIIQYHGSADAAIPVEYSRRYYRAVQKYLGGDVTDFYRLFIMPGVGHCTGGPGADAINADGAVVPFDADHDVVAALIAWVENGKAPDRIIATHLQVDSSSSPLAPRATREVQFTRPLCVYPKHAAWNGAGSPDEASSFACR